MLVVTKTLWTCTTRIGGDMSTSIHTSEQDAVESLRGLIHTDGDDDDKGYEGPLTREFVEKYFDDQMDEDGYDEMVIEEHTVDLTL